MSIKVIVTFVITFIIACFSVFNTTIVEINLCGFQQVEIPMSIFTFFIFLAGAIYVAVITFQDQLNQKVQIRKLKQRMKQLQMEEKNESHNKILSVNKELVQNAICFSSKPRVEDALVIKAVENGMIENKKKNDNFKNDDKSFIKKPEIDIEDALLSEMREFALRKIENEVME